MTRRRGLSLIEVLVALFIMGLGVIAILTMFPLGAYQMAVAVREDRSAQSAAAADAYIRTYWKINVVEQGGGSEPFFLALNGTSVGLPLALDTEPSYPVAVDPMGVAARSGVNKNWLGDLAGVNPSTNIPRQNLNLITTSQYAQRVCSLMDGLGYDDDGRPLNPAGTGADRELRYNWLWVIQRTNNANKLAANLTVVVFDRRAHLYAPVGSEAVFSTVANGAVPGTSSVTLTGSPDVKPGGWIMDASVNVPGRPLIRHANFYRVTSVSGNTLELQSPLKTPTDNNNTPYTGTFVVLRGVSGVYPRPPLSASE
jgi:prepilin-type N-terminal cleavage/methylation domain-containing protein